MKISKQGIDLIKRFEGLRLQAYKCPAGVWTIGYGHTRGVREGMMVTENEADDLLFFDLTPIENALTNLNCNVPLKQCQFDALCSFIFNLGMGNWLSSTLRKKVMADANDNKIMYQITRWCYHSGNRSDGLFNRRCSELELYFNIKNYTEKQTTRDGVVGIEVSYKKGGVKYNEFVAI